MWFQNFDHDVAIFHALQDLFRDDLEKLNRVKNTFSIKTSYYCFTLDCLWKKKKTIKILQIFACDASKTEFLEWCSRWCFQNNIWLLIVAQRSQIAYDSKFLMMIRTKWTIYKFQSRDANRDDYNNDSSVKFLFSENWFICINWLELKLHVFNIQTNRCFIKNKIRDLLCIWRFSIEIFNDYRISLIHDLFLIFKIFELKFMQLFWLHCWTNISKSVF